MVDDDSVVDQYTLQFEDEPVLDIEYIDHEEWDGMEDPCPECDSTEFDHIRYEGGHYGQYHGTVIERTDYCDQKGSLYTACYDCGEVLCKSPAYDVLEAFETGDIGNDSISTED